MEALSRLINAPIQVTLGPAGDRPGLQPVSFLYRQERHQVTEILDTFAMAEPWWEDPNAVGRAPQEVTFWRVRTRRGGIFELTQSKQEWRLYKAYD